MRSAIEGVYGWCTGPARWSNARGGTTERQEAGMASEHAGEDRAATSAALAALGAATLGESGGRAAHRRLRPAWAGASLAAPAYPVRCTPGDNLAVHVAVTKAPRGSVLVVDVGEVADRGYWGEVLTTAAESAGLAGLVLDGGVRDVAALEAHGFPVFSSCIALTGATKDKPGTVGLPVRVGDVVVEEGDWVVADVDGVTFVPGGGLADVVAAGRAREAKEAGFFDALHGGATTVQLLGLDASLVTESPDQT
jgi:4-hydroxy-4-methyl-2-oxoglutarate aldolase